MGYVDYPLRIDTVADTAAALADLARRLKIDPAALNEGDPQVAAVEGVALYGAMLKFLLVDFAEHAYRHYGRAVLGVEQVAAASATMPTTWTLADALGHTIPTGTRVAARGAAGQMVAFATDAAVEVPAGSSTAAVTLTAVVTGAAGNGYDDPLTLVDPLAFVAAVTAAAPSSGGVDAETGPAYSGRLVEELRLLYRVPVFGWQFEVAARRVPGVHRARARDTYDFSTSTSDAGGHVTVAIVDAAGAAVSAAVKAAVKAELEADDRRQLNIVVHVVDPALTAVDVDFAAVALPGHDPVTVEAAAVAALEALLDPGRWGGGGEDPPVWRTDTAIRVETVIGELHRVPGVDRYADTVVSLNGGTADVVLDVTRGLPGPVTTGTVT